MRWILVILSATALAYVWGSLSGCSTMPVGQIPSANSTPLPIATPKPVVALSKSIGEVLASAASSKCAQVSFKNRGRAPKGFIKGIAVSYARAVCQGEKPLPIGSDDALAHYGVAPTLRNTYALLVGLGMRESSGMYCCGRDMSADFSSASSAEAGAFQSSYGSRLGKSGVPRGGGVLVNIYEDQVKAGGGCFLDVFKEGVGTCSESNLKNWGDGEGARFQKLSKECPGFATRYAAALIRVHGGVAGEFGPIRRKEAELRPECLDMLADVENAVSKNPALCQEL